MATIRKDTLNITRQDTKNDVIKYDGNKIYNPDDVINNHILSELDRLLVRLKEDYPSYRIVKEKLMCRDESEYIILDEYRKKRIQENLKNSDRVRRLFKNL